jgi:uncharacterized membrane protein YfcA
MELLLVTRLPVQLDMELLFFVLAGFLNQLIDGTLGMASGVTCTSLLLTVGYSPAAASASVQWRRSSQVGYRDIFIGGSATSITRCFAISCGPAGVCIGGAVAASLAAKMARRIKAELLMIAVGIVIVLLSLRTLVMTFFS